MIRLSVDALEKALVRLEEGFAEAACYPQLLTVRDGVIQRFEIAMDLSWKQLQRALKDIYQVDEGAVLSKRDIFRQAAKHRLLEDTETWFGHYEARNKTSHIYDSEEAAPAFERARPGGDLYSMYVHVRAHLSMAEAVVAGAREVAGTEVALYQVAELVPEQPQDHGFMYGHGFQDLDGHIWELIYMDPSAIRQG